MTELQRWLELLEENGGRVTGPRRAIAELLVNSDRALGPIDIFDQARKTYPSIGLVTIYRTLEILQEIGLVEKVHQVEGCHMFLRAAKGHEHLMLCTHCGKATYFSGDELGIVVQKVASHNGFQVQNHLVQLYGLCKDCH